MDWHRRTCRSQLACTRRMLEEQAGNAEAAAELKARVAALNARAPQPHNVTRKTGKWFAPGARVKRPTS